MKNVNRLLVIGFVLYWAVSFFGIIPDTAFSEKVKNNTLLSLVFPPKYTMYTKPPHVMTIFNYKFYRGDSLLKQVNQVDFLNEEIKKGYPFKTKEYFRDYLTYFGVGNRFTHLTEDYFYKQYSGEKLNYSYSEYVDSTPSLKKYVHNAKLFRYEIIKKHNDLSSNDKVVMEIIWNPNRVSFDPENEKRFSLFMGRKIILTDTIN